MGYAPSLNDNTEMMEVVQNLMSRINDRNIIFSNRNNKIISFFSESSSFWLASSDGIVLQSGTSALGDGFMTSVTQWYKVAHGRGQAACLNLLRSSVGMGNYCGNTAFNLCAARPELVACINAL
jgi:hypothetical protein